MWHFRRWMHQCRLRQRHVGVINCVTVVIEAANPSSFQVLMKNAEDCSFSVWEVNINHLQLIRRDDEPDVP